MPHVGERDECIGYPFEGAEPNLKGVTTLVELDLSPKIWENLLIQAVWLKVLGV